MIYGKSYKAPTNPRPHHVTVADTEMLLEPIPWGWNVVLESDLSGYEHVPIGCVWRCVHYTEATGAEYIMWNACPEPCPEGDEESRREWMSQWGEANLHETRRDAITVVLCLYCHQHQKHEPAVQGATSPAAVQPRQLVFAFVNIAARSAEEA